jgi:hypothetical protein
MEDPIGGRTSCHSVRWIAINQPRPNPHQKAPSQRHTTNSANGITPRQNARAPSGPIPAAADVGVPTRPTRLQCGAASTTRATSGAVAHRPASGIAIPQAQGCGSSEPRPVAARQWTAPRGQALLLPLGDQPPLLLPLPTGETALPLWRPTGIRPHGKDRATRTAPLPRLKRLCGADLLGCERVHRSSAAKIVGSGPLQATMVPPRRPLSAMADT